MAPTTLAEEPGHKMRKENMLRERRTGCRFGLRRELRYRLVEGRTVVAAGAGYTIDMGSGGVAFFTDKELRPGACVELSISWPALLDQTCPIRLNVVGRVLRGAGRSVVCTVDTHEFRTAGASRTDVGVYLNSMFDCWTGKIRAVSA